MPQTTQIRVTRKDLITDVTKLINDGIITDITVDEVLRVTWPKLFYIALRHSESFLNLDFFKDRDVDTTSSTFQTDIIKVQELMTYFHAHPPIALHLYLVNDLSLIIHNHAVPRYTTAEELKVLLDEAIAKYLAKLSAQVAKIMKDDSSLKRYLSVPQRFYHSESDPDYNPEDFDFHEYRQYEAVLQELFKEMVDNKLPPSLISYILADDPYSAFFYTTEDFTFPVISNFLPYYIRNRFMTRDPIFFSSDVLTDTTFRAHRGRARVLGSPTPESLDQLVFGRSQKAKPIQRDSIIHSFPQGFISHGFGSINDVLSDPKKGTTLGSTTDSSDSKSGTVDQPTNIPDDTDYEPDPVYSFKMRHELAQIQALDPFPEHWDHMTRFKTTTEEPVSVSKHMCTNDDYKVFKGRSLLEGYVIVTFTRKSRKPIFNSVC